MKLKNKFALPRNIAIEPFRHFQKSAERGARIAPAAMVRDCHHPPKIEKFRIGWKIVDCSSSPSNVNYASRAPMRGRFCQQ